MAAVDKMEWEYNEAGGGSPFVTVLLMMPRVLALPGGTTLPRVITALFLSSLQRWRKEIQTYVKTMKEKTKGEHEAQSHALRSKLHKFRERFKRG